jgi:hypothetical protein
LIYFSYQPTVSIQGNKKRKEKRCAIKLEKSKPLKNGLVLIFDRRK